MMEEEAALVERYTAGEVAEILALEMVLLRRAASPLSEKEARWSPAPSQPSTLELISTLAAELLPHGPAPSLRDALDALDHLYAEWQSEPAAFQRVQARRLADASTTIGLYVALLRE